MGSKSDKFLELMGQFEEEKKTRGTTTGDAIVGSKTDKFNQLMGEWENEKITRAKSAQQTVTGGILGAIPGAKMISAFPEYPGLLKQNKSLEQRLADLRKAQEDLYTLEGPYGYLANDTVSPEKRAEYQARYDEILNQYGKDATSDSLREQMEQLEGELNANRDRITESKNWTQISGLSEQELDTLYRYSTARNTPFEVVNGQVRLPSLMIQTDPDVRALFDKYGKEHVDKLAETLGRDVNRTAASYMQEEGQKIGESLGFGAIPLGVGSGMLSAVSNPIGILHSRLTDTGQYSTADPYNPGSMFSYLSQGIGAGGAKKAPEQMVNLLEGAARFNPYVTEGQGAPTNYKPQLYEATRGTKAGEVIDAVGSGAYQVVNTAVDTMARAYLGGGLFGAGTTGAKALSLGLAGARSFGDTFNDVSAKGGTPTQAAVLGVFNAGTEIATEYIPLEEWWKIAEGGKAGVAEMLKAAAKQGAIEMTQEEIGFLATTMAEYAVLREKSEFQVLKKDLIASGMTEEQAERAMWEEFGRQAAGVAVTSFFSGGLSTAGAQAFRSLMPGAITNEDASPAGAADSPVAEGAATTQSAPQTAPPTQGSLGTGDVSEAGTVPEAQTPLTRAQDYYRQNGTISNSMAEAILADNDALTELTRLTPVKLDGTKSQNRAEIRAAVARISGEAELSAEGQVQTMADAVSDAELRQTEQVAPEQERLWSNDASENGWGELTDNSVWATALAVKEVNPELFAVYESSAEAGKLSPVIDAVIAASQDVRQKTISPMAAATILDEAYRADGEQGLLRLFNSRNGNLYDEALDRMKAVAAPKTVAGDVTGAVAAAMRGEAYAAAEDTAPRSMTSQETAAMPEGSLAQGQTTGQERQWDQEHGAVGAAEAGFTGMDAYYELLEKGEKPDRAGDELSGRAMQVPETDTQGRRVSDVASNLYTARITTNETAEAIEDLILTGAFGYDRQSNQEAVDRAVEEIEADGIDTVRDRVLKNAASGSPAEGDIARAILLYNHYNRVGDIRNASEMAVTLSMLGNRAGRDLQLFSLIRKMTPEGRLMTVQKTIDAAVGNVNKGRGKRNQQQEIMIPEEMRQMYTALARMAASGELSAAGQIAMTLTGEDTQRAKSAAEEAVKAGMEGQELAPNDMAERVGQRVADNLQREAADSGKSVEDILYEEIMRFANDKVDAGSGRATTQTAQDKNLRALADYYRYQPFFQRAWDVARDRVEAALAEMPADDPRVEIIYSFLNSGLENDSPVMYGMDYTRPNSTVRRAAGEAAREAGVRMDNRMPKGDPGQEIAIRREMVDALIMNRSDKAMAAQAVAELAVSKMGLTGYAADALATDITEAFYEDMAERCAREVQRLLTPRVVNNSTAKTIARRLGELYNMGAFDDESVRQALMDTVFGKDSGIDIPNELLEKYVTATEDQLWDAEEAIYKYAGSQMTSTFADRWRAWRYMAMLGNARTQFRNFFGNVAFMPFKQAKDAIGAAAERVFLEQNQRTKAVLNLTSENDRQLLNWAKADAKSKPVHRAMEFSAQMGEDVSRGIMMDNRRIFNNKGLEAVRKFVAKVPGEADMLFKNPHYASSLAGFLKARGYTAEQVSGGQVPAEVMAEGRTYAINEAMRATFNDCNGFSDWVSSLGRKGKKGFFPALGNAAGEAIMPFRRTPANILVRFVEYSPMGMLTTAGKAIQQARNGEFSAATMIDGLASSFTGTALAGLGALMASGVLGFRLHGGVDDEDDKRRGIQSYSIEYDWDGKTYTYTIDWLAPANLPLFLGANLYEAFTEESEETTGFTAFTKFLYGCGTALEPMLELSCLSGIADLAEGMRYVREGEGVTAAAAKIATSYFTQGIPALVRQLYQASQETEMKTFANSDDPLIRGAEKALANVPFLGALWQTEKLDQWGEEVSRGSLARRAFDAFLNPGKRKEVDTSELEDEISRLNAAQPENVSPPEVPKAFAYTGKDGQRHENYRLTREEYDTLQRVQGQTARALLDEIVGSDAYAAMNDRQKAAIFESVYDYAREAARDQAIADYEPDYSGWMEDLRKNGTGALFARTAQQGISGAFDDLSETGYTGAAAQDAIGQMEAALDVYRGLSKDQKEAFLEGNSGRVASLIRATESGMSAATFAELYGHYKEIEGNSLMSKKDQANAWGAYLYNQQKRGKITPAQVAQLREDIKIWQQIPMDPAKLDTMVEGGLGTDAAMDTIDLIAGLEPKEGNAEVTPAQKWAAIVGSDLTDSEMDIAIKAYMDDYNPDAKSPDRTELKYDAIRDMGFSPEQFVDMYETYSDTKGKWAKIAALDAMPGVSTKEARLLYDIYSGDYFKKK